MLYQTPFVPHLAISQPLFCCSCFWENQLRCKCNLKAPHLNVPHISCFLLWGFSAVVTGTCWHMGKLRTTRGLMPQRTTTLDVWGMGTSGEMLPSSAPWADNPEVHSTWLLRVPPDGAPVLTAVASRRMRPGTDFPSRFTLPTCWAPVSQNQPPSCKPFSF